MAQNTRAAEKALTKATWKNVQGIKESKAKTEALHTDKQQRLVERYFNRLKLPGVV